MFASCKHVCAHDVCAHGDVFLNFKAQFSFVKQVLATDLNLRFCFPSVLLSL